MNYNNWSCRDFLNDLWGIKKKEIKLKPSYPELVKSERIDEFDKLANNRLVMGAFRYGSIHKQNFDDYNLLEESKKRVERYKNDGNLEHLIDAVNMLRLRFFWGRKKGEKFEPIDDAVHTQKTKELI
jgi:hypothetical protein